MMHDRFERYEMPTPERVQVKEGDLDYKNVDLLRKCLGGQGQMFSRRRTAFTAQRQRLFKKAIKRARHMALLPFVD